MRCRNLGRFKVSEAFFDSIRVAGEGANLFDQMVVLQADRFTLYQHGHIEYYAIHPDFRAISEGELVPEYEPTFLRGRATPDWVEVKP